MAKKSPSKKTATSKAMDTCCAPVSCCGSDPGMLGRVLLVIGLYWLGAAQGWLVGAPGWALALIVAGFILMRH
ncbi:hypothetical protein AUJ68_05995 [Candidatus Woesearchaeota archaeon CG1_02_57_44]|nr:MAG: hypothetical protein AUJ68_05995 [Candidatus Woesearchaeota archaeon CG1_02_57_44]